MRMIEKYLKKYREKDNVSKRKAEMIHNRDIDITV